MITLRSLIPFALLLCSGCGETPQAPTASTGADAEGASTSTAAALDELYAAYWEANLELNPLQATFVGDPRYNDQLPDLFSAEYRQRSIEFEQRWLDRLQAIDPVSLDRQQRLSYEVFEYQREIALQGEQQDEWLLGLNHYRNIAQQLVQLGSGNGPQPFASVQDYDHWLARAGRAPVLMASAIANMRLGVEHGVVQPRVLMERLVAQLDGMITDDPTQSLFWAPIEKMPEGFDQADRERLSAAYLALIGDQLMPAYRTLRDFIRDEYLPACRDSHGYGDLPQGEQWYAHRVKLYTSTDLSAAEIHQIGLDEVARIHQEMREVMAQVGYEGELQAFFAHLRSSPEFKYDSVDALLAAYESVRETVEAKVPALFSLVPETGYEIRPVPAYREAVAASGNYQRPSEDRSRPGIFFVNTYDLPARTTFGRETLFLHEAIPGHHFQLALQQELSDLPKFRRFGRETAFSEGWGLYAESLGPELGVYADPYQYFGHLQAELFRAIRLVVDTGLHSKGWSREQVIDYMRQNSAVSDTQATAEAERYMANPGQALAYKIGELTIQRLRAEAEQSLGERFDIRAFHAEVLRDGSLPMAILERKIRRWISEQQS